MSVNRIRIGRKMVTYDLKGQLAVVTGGAGGLGIAIARGLMAARAQVALWDLSPADLARAKAELGPDVRTACVDVTDEGAVAAAAQDLQSGGERIAILINNAGILGPVANSWQVDPAAFRRVIEVNLTGAFICNRVIVPLMLADPPVAGRIVNLASTQGKEGTAMASAYAASKAGLIALTKVLGKELASTGILVNAIAPTAAEGAMAQSLTGERRADLLARIPMGRFVTPEEVAAQVLWLSSEACSFATGAVFDLSGGRATS